MARQRADYRDRPYADIVVFKHDGAWWIRLQGREAGPSPSKARAIAAAIETATRAERAGKTARVQVQTGVANFEAVWPQGRSPR
jgi:hypothetical protein